MAKRVTSIDVARAAGVSQSTVSRTYSGASVSPEKRELVLAAASKLGYNPNAIARSMTSGQTDIIGVVMGDISSPFYPYVLEKFTTRLQQIGKHVLLFNVPLDQDIDAVLPLVLQYRVDGLIITSTTLSSEMADVCTAAGTPVLLFNRYVLESDADAVCCDNVEGGRLVANLLVDAGHREIAYIAGDIDTSTNRDREKGFSDRLRERGISAWRREQGNYTYSTGYAATKRLLTSGVPPQALFCANDIMALGALDCARDLSVAVPNELAVIGFDDIPASGWSAYGLTTLRQPVNVMVDGALEMLFDRIDNPERPAEIRLVPGRLIQRNSARVNRI